MSRPEKQELVISVTVAMAVSAQCGAQDEFLFFLGQGEDESAELEFQEAMDGTVYTDDLDGFVQDQAICAPMNGFVTARLLDAFGNSEGCGKSFGSDIIQSHCPLVCGQTLVNSPPGILTRSPQIEFVFEEPVQGFGLWVFDDSDETEQHFHLYAWDVNGELAISPALDNPESQQMNGHWVEGFVGVSSPIGIERVVIKQVIDEGLDECAFEVDNLQLALLGTCYADMNGDGDLNVLDFIEFQELWKAKDPRANCHVSPNFNILDFLCFQAEFEAGCP